jgi:predicted O-methyltransferase YrrM
MAVASLLPPSSHLARWQAKKNLTEAGLVDLVEFRYSWTSPGYSATIHLCRERDAVQTLAQDLPEEIGLVLLDGAKNLYLPILKLLEQRLKTGAVVAADNADVEPEYRDYVRHPATGYVSLDLALERGTELSVRVARS